MKERNIQAITRKQLIEEMRKLGHTDINERKIEDWQTNDLLPVFDIGGRGRGRGRGEKLMLGPKVNESLSRPSASATF